MKILFIFPYPIGQSPSQRFRFEQYFSFLEEEGCHCYTSSFLSLPAWKVIYQNGHYVKKVFFLIQGFIFRLILLLRLPLVDYVFIHREALPFGPPVIEFVISKVFNKKVIYDFDDAIWLSENDKASMVKKFFKSATKVKYIIKCSTKIVCGNDYLKEYAIQYNKNVVVIPTTVDTVHVHNKIKNQKTSSPTIGWTGSHSTLFYLEAMFPLLEKVYKKKQFELIVICNKKPLSAPSFMKFIKWDKETEIDDLMTINIGIMPLIDDAWAKGKCGFKAIQYMALGIPALVSPVGVNNKIVDHGLNGFICNTDDDWIRYLVELLEDSHLRMTLGTNARIKIEEKYSLISNKRHYVNLFR